MVEYDTGANNLAQNLSETRVEQQPGEDGTADYKWQQFTAFPKSGEGAIQAKLKGSSNSGWVAERTLDRLPPHFQKASGLVKLTRWTPVLLQVVNGENRATFLLPVPVSPPPGCFKSFVSASMRSIIVDQVICIGICFKVSLSGSNLASILPPPAACLRNSSSYSSLTFIHCSYHQHHYQLLPLHHHQHRHKKMNDFCEKVRGDQVWKKEEALLLVGINLQVNIITLKINMKMMMMITHLISG